MSETSYAKCHHVYEPQREDELKLNVGDAVEVTSKEYDTWWVGKNLTTQQSGWFPSNFVTSTEAPETEQASVESPSKPQQMPQPPQSPEPLNPQSNVESHEEQVEPVTPKVSSVVPKTNSLAEVQHDYEAQASDELSLEKGAIVTILEEVDGWYKGDLNGRIGLFPANFVKRIEGNSPESEVEEAQPKQKGFRLAAYGVKQGGIGSLFAGGMPSLRKANRHSQEIQEHQAPVVEAANEVPVISPKKNIPLPPTPPTPQAEHQEEPAPDKSSSTLSSEAHVPEKPDLPRVSTDSSNGRQSIEESRSPSPTKRRSVFGGFRPPIPKIPIPKFPTLPKKNVPAVPREESSTATSPPEQAIAEPSLEAAQPTSPKVPHVRTPLPPIPSGLPPTLPSSPPQAPHARSPLPPVPQEDSHVSSPPPPAPQEQRNIRSSLPPVPHMEPHVRSPLPPVPQMESHVKSPLPPAPQEQRNVRVSLPPVPHMEPHIRSPLPAVPQEQPHIRSPLPPVPQGMSDIEPPLSPVRHEEPAISSVDEPEHLGESHVSSSLPPMYTSEAQPNEQVLEGSQGNPDMEEKKNRSLDFEEHSGPKLALVEDDFEAQSSSHLTLRKGGVVTILAQGEDWWRGEMNGKIGLFPPHLVKIIEQPTVGGESSESGGNAPRGGFRLAAYGVKQGGIGGLFAGGLPKLRKTGRRMGSEEPSNTPSEPERSQASSTSTPELRPQASDLPPYGANNEAPSRSNTHESTPQIPSVPSRTSSYESEPQVQNLSRSSTRESLPPVPSVPSHTSTYEPEPQVQNSSRSNTREVPPPVPSVPSRTSTHESEPPMENLSRTSTSTSTRDSLPQGPSIPRTSTHESVPQVPSVPSRTSTYESSPSIPSRTSTHESVPQIPSVPSRTTSDPHPEQLESLDSSSQIPLPPNRSGSDEPQPNNQQYQDDNFESQLAAPVIPSRSSSTDISPQIPSRAPQPISSRSSAYSVDSELAALENTIPSPRNIPELEVDSEAPEPALPSRTSFYRVDTPRSPTPGQSVHFDSGPHSPTTPLPSGNGSQTELPIPTGLPSRENTQESSPSIPPRRSPSFGLGQSSRSGREPSQRNSVHGYDSIGSPIRTDHSSQLNKRNSVQDILVSSPIPNREENHSPDNTSNQLDTYSENDDTGVISLKSENEEFFEANDELEIPHEPEPTPNNATPRHTLEEHDTSTNLEQVDRALISETLEENSKRGIDQVERTFVADDNSKKQEIENPHEESTSQVVEDLNESDKIDAEDVEEVNTQLTEEDQQVPEESATPLLPALPESQPLSSLTKGRPMRNKRKPTPVAREATTSQTELLQKAIEEDTQTVDTSKEADKSSVEPVKVEAPISREISKESSDNVNSNDSEPRLVKPSAFRGQATPFANLSFGKSGVPGLLNKTGHVGELGRRIGSGNYENNHGEGTSTSDIAPRKYQGVAGASQALALSELENKMKNWMKEELQKLKEELKEEREARQRLEEELRELKESRE